MKPGPAQRRYATIAEIAAELRVSVDTLRREGVLDGVRSAKVGRARLYLWSDVDRVVFGDEGSLAARRRPATSGSTNASSKGPVTARRVTLR